MCPPDGDWQLQVPPGAPGTARQGPTRIIMLVNDGGIATQPKAPGHDRPFTASTGAAKHGRPRAATRSPGAGVPLATVAGAPGQHRLSAMANATVALPAGLRRLRQESLSHTPANPRTHTHTTDFRAIPSPRNAGGLQGGQIISPASSLRLAPQSTHQVHPAIQVPPHPRSCSTAHTGFFAQHPSRAPPPSRHCGAGRNPGPCIAPGHRADSPSL